MPYATKGHNFVHFTVATFATILLSACAAPTRSDADAFFILKEGQIAPQNVHAFSDCLLDGFDKAHFMIHRFTSRQQRRSNSFRIETLAGGRIITVSADVFDDGKVVLNESKSAALINTSGQRDAFDSCLVQFGT